jgi:hypothetical protein
MLQCTTIKEKIHIKHLSHDLTCHITYNIISNLKIIPICLELTEYGDIIGAIFGVALMNLNRKSNYFTRYIINVINYFFFFSQNIK